MLQYKKFVMFEIMALSISLVALVLSLLSLGLVDSAHQRKNKPPYSSPTARYTAGTASDSIVPLQRVVSSLSSEQRADVIATLTYNASKVPNKEHLEQHLLHYASQLPSNQRLYAKQILNNGSFYRFLKEHPKLLESAVVNKQQGDEQEENPDTDETLGWITETLYGPPPHSRKHTNHDRI